MFISNHFCLPFIHSLTGVFNRPAFSSSTRPSLSSNLPLSLRRLVCFSLATDISSFTTTTTGSVLPRRWPNTSTQTHCPLLATSHRCVFPDHYRRHQHHHLISSQSVTHSVASSTRFLIISSSVISFSLALLLFVRFCQFVCPSLQALHLSGRNCYQKQ